jgi:penicillin-binding protein 2B
VIKSISDQDTGKTLKTTKLKVTGQPISAETAKQVRDYLETVISAKKGTGKKYAIDGYQVAGKTGTAQIAGPTGRYLEGKNNYVFSFLGMAPKDDPQLVMYVAVKQPKLGVSYVGADPLSEIFNPVMQNSLQYLNIKPSEVKKQKANKIKDYTNQTESSAVKELKELGYDVSTIGSGRKVLDQSPKAGSVLLQGEKIILRTEGEMKVPDMKGWSLRDVMKLAKVAKLDLKTEGTGYVSKQSLEAGKKVNEGETFNIELSQPDGAGEDIPTKEKTE